MKKYYIITAVSLTIFIGLYFFNKKQSPKRQQAQQSSFPIIHSPWSLQDENPDQQKIAPLDIKQALKGFHEFCLEQTKNFPTYNTLLATLQDPDLKRLWSNIQLKDADNEVFSLLRQLNPNTVNEQIKILKEDKAEKIINAKTYSLYLEKGTAIFTEEAYSLEQEREKIYFEFTNGEFTRIEVNSPKGTVICQAPY